MIEARSLKYVLKVTQIQRRKLMDLNTNPRLDTSETIRMSNDGHEHSALFEARFSRCHQILCFLARRVLGSSEHVQVAVENCRITASQNPPTFDYEGAFRSWLVRILIDEALAILHEGKND